MHQRNSLNLAAQDGTLLSFLWFVVLVDSIMCFRLYYFLLVLSVMSWEIPRGRFYSAGERTELLDGYTAGIFLVLFCLCHLRCIFMCCIKYHLLVNGCFSRNLPITSAFLGVFWGVLFLMYLFYRLCFCTDI